MVLDFKVECVLDMDRDAYWQVKSTRAFFEFLVADHALYKMEATAEWKDFDGTVHMTCNYIPRTIEIPDIVRLVVGDSVLEVVDEQQWQPVTEDYQVDFIVTPCFLNDKVKTTGSVRLSPHEEPGKLTHVIEGKAEVSLIFVGAFMEEALLDNLKKFYANYPEHVARFKQHMVAMVGKKETDADLVQNFLEQEALTRKGDQEDMKIKEKADDFVFVETVGKDQVPESHTIEFRTLTEKDLKMPATEGDENDDKSNGANEPRVTSI